MAGYSPHTLGDFISRHINLMFDELPGPPEIHKVEDRSDYFHNNYLSIVDYYSGSIPLPFVSHDEDPSLALQPTLKSDASVRSKLYEIVYSHNRESVDLGSGSFLKGLHKKMFGVYVGPRCHLVDRKLPAHFPTEDVGENMVVGHKIDFENEENFRRLVEEKRDCLFTSSNALMKIPPSSFRALKGKDCLFTLPCARKLKSCDAARAIEGEEEVYVTMYNGEYVEEYDHKLDLDFIGEDVQGIYMAFRQRKIKVLRESEVRIDTQFGKKPSRINEVDPASFIPPFVKKLDGYTAIVSLKDGILVYKTFNKQYAFEVDNKEFEFLVEAEMLQMEGTAPVFVIHTLREVFGIPLCVQFPWSIKRLVESLVLDWGEIEPFKLCYKLPFEDVESCLLSSEEYGPYEVGGRGLTEGVISTVFQVAGKVFETVDLFTVDRQYMEELRDYLLDVHGRQLKYPQHESLAEYALVVNDDNVSLAYLKDRVDKKVPNDIRRVKKILSDILSPRRNMLMQYMEDKTLARYQIYKAFVAKM